MGITRERFPLDVGPWEDIDCMGRPGGHPVKFSGPDLCDTTGRVSIGVRTGYRLFGVRVIENPHPALAIVRHPGASLETAHEQ